MTALTYLSRAPGLRWIDDGPDRSAVVAAIALLEREGLITLARPGYPSPDVPVAITPKGIEFIQAAERVSALRDS
jgi:DNA-binding MarR family transcriptional regulator